MMLTNENCCTVAAQDDRPESAAIGNMQMTAFSLCDEAKTTRDQAMQLMVDLFGVETRCFKDDEKAPQCIMEVLLLCENVLRQTLDMQCEMLRGLEGTR